MPKLIHCKACGKEVSKSAKTCPHCGERLKKGKWKTILLVWFALALISFIVRSQDNEKTASEQNLEVVADMTLQTKIPEKIEIVSSKIKIPQSQKAFIQTVSSFFDDYREAENELQKSSIKNKRTKKIKQLLKGNLSVTDWVGTISIMTTTMEGNAHLALKLVGSQKIIVGTTNNEISDALLPEKTLISIDSDLYKRISSFSKGDVIKFSGHFLADEQNHLYESSLTENGSMLQPEFEFVFEKVEKID